MENVLFSLFVPTRNRAETATVLIDEALTFLPSDCELVVQDCGTDGQLENHVRALPRDPRLRYEHTELVPMTENWNRGMSRCRGEYVTIIGDDDAITREIGRVVRWARTNRVEALAWNDLPGARYYWPNHSVQQLAGTYNMYRYSGALNTYSAAERLERAVRTVGHMGDVRGVPHLYHGLVRRDFIEAMRRRAGSYFCGVNPDVYSQFFLATLINTIHWVDYPVSTGGISAKSNSGVVLRRNRHEYAAAYKEYSRVDWPLLAPLAGSSLSWQATLEGLCQGLTKAGRADLLSFLDVPTYYAQAIYYDRPVRTGNLRRYFRASASLGRGPLRSTFALAQAFVQRAAARYLKATPIPEVEAYEQPTLFTQFRNVQDIRQLLRLQEQALRESNVRAPWDDPLRAGAARQPTPQAS